MDDFKLLYTAQPYRVGSKSGKSLAIIIPSHIVKKLSINTSTIFAIYVDEFTQTLSLQLMRPSKVQSTPTDSAHSFSNESSQNSQEDL